MSDNEEVKTHRETTPRQLLAEGWRLTRAILALSAVEIPDTIEFEIEGENQIRMTFVAAPDHVAGAVATLDEAIEHRSEKRATGSEAPAPTTVFEALFPGYPKKTASEIAENAAEIERWLAIRKEEGLKIDPETAEITWNHGYTLDPYGVLELPEELRQIQRLYFARRPGSDIWVESADLPDETQDRLWDRPSRKPAFPAGSEGLSDISEDTGWNDDIPF